MSFGLSLLYTFFGHGAYVPLGIEKRHPLHAVSYLYLHKSMENLHVGTSYKDKPSVDALYIHIRGDIKIGWQQLQQVANGCW